MSNNNKDRNILSGKGYYIALILCAVVIGITGYVYYRNTQAVEEASMQQSTGAPLYTYSQEDVPAIATKGQEEIPTVPTTQATEQTPTETRPQPKRKLKTTAPVAGEEIAGYSMEALSYNQTTRDWRVHNGVDIAAAEGTPVFAAAEGVVEAAYEDDLMGYTVVIAHDGGYTTQYSSLSKDLSVQSGEAVAMGQAIGCVGDTALVETTLGHHVHFSAACQGAPMDPAEFLKLGE